MKKRTIDQERRLQRRLEYLGTNNPKCLHCPENNPFCLELHEPGGRDFCDLPIIECRNCHRKLEEMRRDHPRQFSFPPTDLECIAHSLLGMADVFELLIAWLRKQAEILLQRPTTTSLKSSD